MNITALDVMNLGLLFLAMFGVAGTTYFWRLSRTRSEELRQLREKGADPTHTIYRDMLEANLKQAQLTAVAEMQLEQMKNILAAWISFWMHIPGLKFLKIDTTLRGLLDQKPPQAFIAFAKYADLPEKARENRILEKTRADQAWDLALHPNPQWEDVLVVCKPPTQDSPELRVFCFPETGDLYSSAR